MADEAQSLRPAPDVAMVSGSLAATAGYLLPTYITAVPIGIGLPLLAAGLGLLVAGACRAIVVTVLVRERAVPGVVDAR